MPGRAELLVRNRSFQICLFIIALITMIGVIGPFVILNPNEYVGLKYEPPSLNHILGTDVYGRDVFSGLIHGIRNSLYIGLTAGLLAVTIAILLGGWSGFVGGIPGEIINTVANIFVVLPTVPLLLVLSVAFRQRSQFLVAGLIALLGWAGATRSIRSQVLSLKERDYVNLARLSGKSRLLILFTEIFPNMLSYIFISFCAALGGAILAEAGISLLGLGPTTVITLGMILHYAVATQSYAIGVWWWFIPPGLVLVIYTGTLAVMTSTIDSVLNPKMRRI